MIKNVSFNIAKLANKLFSIVFKDFILDTDLRGLKTLKALKELIFPYKFSKSNIAVITIKKSS